MADERMYVIKQSIREFRHMRGLINHGNTCWINTTVQFLHACRHFTGCIRDDCADTELVAALKWLLDAIEDPGSDGPVSTKRFIAALGSRVKLPMHMQGDVQELVLCLLEELHKDMRWEGRALPSLQGAEPLASRSRGHDEEGRLSGLPVTDLSVLEVRMHQAWKKHIKHDGWSKLTDAFSGQLIVQTKCNACSFATHALEVFTVLTLAPSRVDGRASTTHACMSDFFEDESISGWKCDRCSSAEGASRTVRLWRLPSILLIGTPAYLFAETVMQPDCDLDVGKHTLKSLTFNDQGTSYKLRAVACHSGSNNIHSGHYSCIRRGAGSDGWVIADDEITAKMQGDQFRGRPYMLLYERE
jgi:ubiquitin C-terminal hydrolase